MKSDRACLIWLLTAACWSSVAADSVRASNAPSPSRAAGTGERARHRCAAHLLAAGLQGGLGTTVGPDGALYVTESAAGRISRVDPRTGAVRTFATGLPRPIIGLGGVTDLAFIGRTAYALVTLVGPDLGGTDVVGIYRIEGPEQFTVIADIGAFALANPPRTPFDVPTGLQFAMQPYGGGFLVTDGHHNRVLYVTLHGQVFELIGFDNIVPTGLALSGLRIYMAEAGPTPHLPEDGKVVLLHPLRRTATEIVSGAPLLVDVEVRNRRALYALSQGSFREGDPPGSPALPNTGALVRANWNGSFDVVTDGLNQPTSFEFIRGDAYIFTLNGEVWKVDLDDDH